MKESDKKFLAISVFAVSAFVGTSIACEMFDSQHENVTTWEGNLTIAQLPPHDPRLVIDLESAVKMSSVPIANITVHIGENQTQNVTITLPNLHGNVSIYKGDKVVCYIPR